MDVPTSNPVTTPLPDPMDTLALLLVHVPPAGVEFNVLVNPAQTANVPVIPVGKGLTVTTTVVIHPVDTV